MKVIKKEQLKQKVDEVASKLPENVVFIAGGRQIKNGQVEIEFVQSRSLAGRQTTMLALLNQGDKRFNSGRTLMRAWQMVNEEGFNETFGKETMNFDEFKKLALSSTDKDERVGIFAQSETVNVNGVKQPIKIVCIETVDVNALPKSIREQLADDTVSDDIKQRYILQTKDGDLIVDAFGNKVYRRYELAYGDRTDVLVADKQLASEAAKKAVGVETTANTLKNALAS